MIVSAEALLMVLEKQFCALSLTINHAISKKIKKPGNNLFKKINKSVPSHIIFYLEDDDYKAVDFHGKTTRFICKLIELKKINEPNFDSFHY